MNTSTRATDTIVPTVRRLATAGAVAGLVLAGLVVHAPAASANACMSNNPPPICDPGRDPDPPYPGRPKPTPTPTPPPTPTNLAAPTTLTVSGVSDHTATLSWTDPAGGETGFTVTRTQYETAASTPRVDQFVVAASAGQTSFSLPQGDLQSHQTASWSVVATADGKTPSAAVRAGTLTVTVPTDAPARAQLESFRSDWQSSAFPKVNKAAALADVLTIVQQRGSSSTHIDQGSVGACGPASVEFELVKRDPARFVDVIHSLASSGAFTTPDRTRYAASSALRASARNSGVTEANWLFMATVKDAVNSVRITANVGEAAWMSSPADVDNWLSHIVGLHTTTATAILRPFSTGEKIMPGAAKVLNAGGAVVLLVDSHLVGNPPGLTSVPNHYANLVSWSSTRTTVTFVAATWGIRTSPITVSWNRFNGYTWDVLTAR